ncbi:MAG TPA: sigma-54 dependent transcriptional regulator [Thermodesulfovibrionales bacterium]|nr:sigma-54 dependent transcriptional regulator [Thermodesulfovibrionales bacterium]
MKILLITKENVLKRDLEAVLPKGFRLTRQQSGSESNVIFVDIDSSGVGAVRELSERAFVVAITGQKRTEPVMEATTSGAYEVIHRPLKQETVSRIIQELLDLGEEIERPILLSNPPPTATCAIVGQSSLIMDVCKRLARLAQVEVPILITGETGTGKELIAESVAQLSPRFGKPFVVINCAAVPENLLESELFGFTKGAFTGAISSKEGMLKIADSGTLFFDEVGELPLALQGKLLRFLQTQAFYPIGSTSEIQVDVRVISATNRDLAAMVREGKFREDLYHRLRVAEIHVPPLRERKNDILPLVQFFFYRYRHSAQKPLKGITNAFLNKLRSYDWPGNIRELENAIRSAIAISKTPYLTTHDLKDFGYHAAQHKEMPFPETLSSVLIPFMKKALETRERNLYEKIHREVDKSVFDYILSQTRENQSEAARILGINRLTLRKKVGTSR